jgi:hypothetical protein
METSLAYALSVEKSVGVEGGTLVELFDSSFVRRLIGIVDGEFDMESSFRVVFRPVLDV